MWCVNKVVVLTAEDESVPPDGGVGYEALDAGPVEGGALVGRQLRELAAHAARQPGAQVGVTKPEPRHRARDL